MSARVLVVGLDAGDPTTARELVDASRMPVLGRLLAEGAQHPLTEPYGGAYIVERWTTLSTGVGPDVHRFFTWLPFDSSTGELRQAPMDPEGVDRVWDVLSAAGRRVAVLDVPRQPLSQVNGIHLHEWGSHDCVLRAESWPPDAMHDLEHRFGSYPLRAAASERPLHFTACDFAHWSFPTPRSTEQLRRLRELIRSSIDAKAAVSEHVLASDDWDLFFSVFGESHCAGHQFWHLHEPSCPSDRERRALLGDPVTDTFERFDRSLGRHLELAGPDATTIVILHSGMAAPWGGDFVLRAVVARLDDADALVVCDFPTWFGIRVLVEGRDAGGTVAPAAFTELVARLERSLLALVDDDTGEPAVRAVRSRADAVPGLADDDTMPDVFVEWDGGRVIERVSSPEIGSVYVEWLSVRTGEHTPDGLVVVHGPGVEPGVRAPMPPTALAPRVSGLLGVDYPAGVQARTASASSA